MKRAHHLDDATLTRFAAGDLDEAFAVVVASHIDMCEDCRTRLRTAREVGGQLLEDTPKTALSEGALDRLMAKIDAGMAAPDSAPTQIRTAKGDVPLPLSRYIGANLADVPWRTVAPGIRKKVIPLKSTDSSLYMLHIGEGREMPEHGHGGNELTLVLSGAYRDAMGVFGPGDIADLDEDVEHQPKVEPGASCICLVATERPTRFKGLIARMFQPIAGI